MPPARKLFAPQTDALLRHKRRLRGTTAERVTFTKSRAYPSKQLNEVLRLLNKRHGGLPDTDDADEYLQAIAQIIRWRMDPACEGVGAEPLAFALARWCDELSSGRPSAALINATARVVIRKPRNLTPKTLGKAIRLKFDERLELKITTIHAADISLREQRRRMRARHGEQKRRWQETKRRERGVVPRSQYLDTVRAKASKPWLRAGISRTAWYRNRAVRNGIGTSCVDTHSLS